MATPVLDPALARGFKQQLGELLRPLWVRSEHNPIPRGWLYAVLVFLIAAGLAALNVMESGALPVGILVTAVVYGLGLAGYLAFRHGGGSRDGELYGFLHPQAGLLSTTPRSGAAAMGSTLLVLAAAAYAVWMIKAEVGDLSIDGPDDEVDLHVFGIVLLAIMATCYPLGAAAFAVVRRHGTRTPPADAMWTSLFIGSALGLAAGWLAVQWGQSQPVSGDTGWFADWIEWLPTALVAVNALSVSFRHLQVSSWQARLNEQTARAESAEAARKVAEAQLAMLQAQIEPHFLYNTLASVQYLVRKDAAGADFLLTQLIRYLRHAMPRMRQPLSTLGQEFELADAYLQIARMRMGGRLTVDVELHQALLDLPFPPLVLQTLVENALKHGVEPKLGPVHIAVSARLQGSEIRLQVLDDGVGLGRAPTAGTGTGLSNIRDRLTGIYGQRADLVVSDVPSGGVMATLTLRKLEPSASATHTTGAPA